MRGSTKKLKELESRITVLEEYIETLQQSINYTYNRLEQLESALGTSKIELPYGTKFIKSDDE